MNLLVDEGKHPKALLALEDGTVFEGRSCGAAGETFGEVVFNTSMVGYQEIVSDPSYAGQIVTFTYPQVGNYGVNAIDTWWCTTCATPPATGSACRASPTSSRSAGSSP